MGFSYYSSPFLFERNLRTYPHEPLSSAPWLQSILPVQQKGHHMDKNIEIYNEYREIIGSCRDSEDLDN